MVFLPYMMPGHEPTKLLLQEYGVDTSWRQRHASLTPLFIGSQEQYHQMEDIIPGQPRVRATQQPQFLQTMTQGNQNVSFNFPLVSQICGNLCSTPIYGQQK